MKLSRVSVAWGQEIFNHLLGRPVDLVTDKSLRPELRPFIELKPSMSDRATLKDLG